VPGDQLRLELTVLKYRTSFAKLRGEATVDGQLVAEAVLTCAVADRK
jgi:3-hydroxyacyl-[acyl-carrier-protein] dehydratase